MVKIEELQQGTRCAKIFNISDEKASLFALHGESLSVPCKGHHRSVLG